MRSFNPLHNSFQSTQLIVQCQALPDNFWNQSDPPLGPMHFAACPKNNMGRTFSGLFPALCLLRFNPLTPTSQGSNP